MHFTMHEMWVGEGTVRPHAVTGTFELRVGGGSRSDIHHPCKYARAIEHLVDRSVMCLETAMYCSKLSLKRRQGCRDG